jgi:hypothetical protein
VSAFPKSRYPQPSTSGFCPHSAIASQHSSQMRRCFFGRTLFAFFAGGDEARSGEPRSRISLRSTQRWKPRASRAIGLALMTCPKADRPSERKLAPALPMRSIKSRRVLSGGSPGRSHRFYQRTQRFGFANNGPAIFQFDDALTLPIAKAAVDLFTRSTRHFRQFAL